MIVKPVGYQRVRGMRTAVGAMAEFEEMMRGGRAYEKGRDGTAPYTRVVTACYRGQMRVDATTATVEMKKAVSVGAGWRAKP